MNKESIPTKLKTRRIDLNLSIKQLAEKANMLPPSYSRIEHGRVVPRLKTINELCKVLSLDPKTLEPLQPYSDISYKVICEFNEYYTETTENKIDKTIETTLRYKVPPEIKKLIRNDYFNDTHNKENKFVVLYDTLFFKSEEEEIEAAKVKLLEKPSNSHLLVAKGKIENIRYYDSEDTSVITSLAKPSWVVWKKEGTKHPEIRMQVNGVEYYDSAIVEAEMFFHANRDEKVINEFGENPVINLLKARIKDFEAKIKTHEKNNPNASIFAKSRHEKNRLIGLIKINKFYKEQIELFSQGENEPM